MAMQPGRCREWPARPAGGASGPDPMVSGRAGPAGVERSADSTTADLGGVRSAVARFPPHRFPRRGRGVTDLPDPLTSWERWIQHGPGRSNLDPIPIRQALGAAVGGRSGRPGVAPGPMVAVWDRAGQACPVCAGRRPACRRPTVVGYSRRLLRPRRRTSSRCVVRSGPRSATRSSCRRS